MLAWKILGELRNNRPQQVNIPSGLQTPPLTIATYPSHFTHIISGLCRQLFNSVSFNKEEMPNKEVKYGPEH